MDTHREAGTYNLTWDAGHLPSSVYFAQIQAGDNTSVQKLLLTK
ncbi:T9SS type A sorting domain-containing protein [bacterium]|nr:T9SS type A sorting domain-containing protein [bacterium]